MYNRIKTDKEIDAMRTGGAMLATVLGVVQKNTQTGMTTKDLALVAASEIKSLGGEPAFLGMYGFPDVICISVNEEVVHGIPGKRIINDGDIISIDFGVRYGGLMTDAARSYIVGSANKVQKKLIEDTLRSLDAGIDSLRSGVRVGDIGNAIQVVLDKGGYGIVRDLVGHGVGHELHEEPNIPNYGTKGSGPILKAGQTIAIEPMVTLGSDSVYTADDDWTIVTRDGSLAAHFEDTVLITESGAEILTRL
jgi:methionyl aminopeptidase